MRIFWWVVTILAAIVLALFAVSNRQTVSLGLWPLPYLAEAPLFLIVLLALLLGFVVGGLAAWIGGGRGRREARRRARRIAALERELAATQAELGRGSLPPARIETPARASLPAGR